MVLTVESCWWVNEESMMDKAWQKLYNNWIYDFICLGYKFCFMDLVSYFMA